MLRRLIPLVAAAAVLSIAGCGDSIDKNAYVKDVTSVQQAGQAKTSELNQQIQRAKTQGAVASLLTEQGEAVEASAAQLAAIEPPADVADLHKEYVELMRGYGTGVIALAARLGEAKEDDMASIQRDSTKLSSDTQTEEQRILDKINRQLQS